MIQTEAGLAMPSCTGAVGCGNEKCSSWFRIASIDVDLSMETDFAPEELENIRQRLEQSLDSVFSREGYKVFDVTLEGKPPIVSPEIAQFWGGYSLPLTLP
jgi:hypothetical protein